MQPRQNALHNRIGVAQMPSFVLSGGVGFCNAVRRTLAGDLSMWAPFQLTIRVNSSCHTDEFIAHRIGLIPFKRVGHGDTMELNMYGSCVVYANNLLGPAFEAVYPTIEVTRLECGQQLDLTIHFDKQYASKHARYAPCAAVGMTTLCPSRQRETRRIDRVTQHHDDESANDSTSSDIDDEHDDESDRCKISFEIIDGRTPVEIMQLALDRLEERIDRALIALGDQPTHPPKSMC